MNIKNIDDKIHGGLFGLLIGDAVGVPYEFKSKNEIKNIAMFPHDLINKTYPNIPYGTWSDDGSQSLILLESLITQGCLDLNNFLQNLEKWLFNGYMAVDQKVFDVGIQSYEYISTFKKQGFFEVGPHPKEHQNGNGSLMLCLPLVLWHRGSNQALVELAHEQSLVTHPHIRSQVCCAWYCLIAKQLFIYHDFNKAMRISTQILTDIYLETSNMIALDEFNNHVLSYNSVNCQGTGYVVDSLMTALLCLQEKTYEDVIKKAISFGNDTDTTACIAGGLAGILFGFEAIPQKWIDGLRGKDMVYPLLEKLAVITTPQN